jgi:hypothetical protein
MSATEIVSLFDAPGSLVRDFLDAAEDAARPCWDTAELQSVFAHQWFAPLALDLGDYGKALRESAGGARPECGLAIRSFADLMVHEHPPLALLNLTKEFAKRNLYGSQSTIPHDVARVIYFASIAVAMNRCHSRMSALSAAQLREGFGWCLAQGWLTEGAERVLRQGIEALREWSSLS